MRRASRISVPYAVILFCILWAGLVLLLPACAVRDVVNIERVNARTQLEERAFNVLLVSETIITAAEASNTARTLPEYMKPIINRLIDVHNLGKKAADRYVSLLGSATEAEAAAELAGLLGDLDQAITEMFQGGGP